MHTCPICETKSDKPVAGTPYYECPTCLVWFQSPMPPKLYQAPEEYDLSEMPDGDKAANQQLAQELASMMRGPLPDRLDNDIGHMKSLDIGCKHPWLAHYLHAEGMTAAAMDGVTPTQLPGVRVVTQDFETLRVAPTRERYDLITMVHVFEHMYDPLAALRKLRLMVEDDGRVFLRLPDRMVEGYQRDLTPQHFKIHPYFHCMSSILEALAQCGNMFVVEWSRAWPGAGQRDLLLRPIKKRPTIAVCGIVKNEERDLPRALESVRPFADFLAITDTGSTDRTVHIARSTLAVLTYVREYLGASERDEHGDWKLWDFAKARNEALTDAELTGADYIFWIDADDEVLTPDAIRRAAYWPEYDVFECWIDGGGPAKWVHHRMWKASKHVRFAGRVHEYPIIDGLRVANIGESVIKHHAEPSPTQENSNPRNLRILEREWAEAPTPRCAYYIADTYRGAGRNEEAARWYLRRWEMRDGYEHERAFAGLYGARVLRTLGRHDEADAISTPALVQFPGWMEFQMELANGMYMRGHYDAAIEVAVRAITKTIPYTALWREPQMYGDQPARLISWSFEHAGELDSALEWSAAAAKMIGGPDADWEQRHRRLQGMIAARDEPKAPAITTKRRFMIGLHRPGAIGDILMTLNLVPLLREKHGPDADIHYFCDPRLGAADALGGIINQAGCSLILDAAAANAWRPNYDLFVSLVGYPLHEGYPERPMRQHLLRYFAHEMGVDLPDSDALPALTLPRPPLPSDFQAPKPGPYATLQMRAGWSDWKMMPAAKWNAIRSELLNTPIVLIDEASGFTLSESIAIFANARMHIGVDSFCGHLTNYFWTDEGGGRRVPGVIVWGSTQPSAAGYQHNTNVSHAPECAPCFRENPAISRMPRGVCTNPPTKPDGSARTYGDGLHKCMADITAGEVLKSILEVWRSVK